MFIIIIFTDISKWNTNKLTNMISLFYECSSLLSLLIFQNGILINLLIIFYGCSSLLSLPNISKWNTSNVTDMSYMFFRYSSLSSLPDISKWNTNNAIDMRNIFYGCSSLSSLPDISNWKTIYNDIYMSSTLDECLNIIISKIIKTKFHL